MRLCGLRIGQDAARRQQRLALGQHTPRALAAGRIRTGSGLFALEPIRVHARMTEYEGEVTSAKEAGRRGGKYLFIT